MGFFPGISSVLKDIPDEIMVFIKGWKVVMSATVYADKRYLMRVDLLQTYAVPDRDKHISCTVNDIGVAIYITYPLICPQMESQYQPYGKNG